MWPHRPGDRDSGDFPKGCRVQAPLCRGLSRGKSQARVKAQAHVVALVELSRYFAGVDGWGSHCDNGLLDCSVGAEMERVLTTDSADEPLLLEDQEAWLSWL